MSRLRLGAVGAGLLTVALALLSANLHAQATNAETPPVPTIDELLTLVKQGRTEANAEAEQRVADFERRASERAAMVARIAQELLDAEQRSRQLEEISTDLQIEIEALRRQKEEKQGSLKEVFGNIQAASSELATLFDGSLTSPQLGKARITFLAHLAEELQNEDRLPEVADLERFWYEYLREIAESGRVVKFHGNIRSLQGIETGCEIVRVGTFNSICGGEYLVLSESNPSIYSQLPRQPGEGIGFGGKYLAPAHALNAAQTDTSTIYKFGFDPTGPSGSGLLRSLISIPDLGERVAQGREVGYTIIAVGIIGLLIAIYKLGHLGVVGVRVSFQERNVDSPQLNNPLGRILAVYNAERDSDIEALELKLAEAIARERPRVERLVAFLKIIAAVAPLMGLLGTVTGMIDTFQQITLFGTGDPKTMAGGISQALVTTVLGLCVAIPMILLHAIVHGRAQTILHVLEERSIGIVARRAEELAEEYLREQHARADDEVTRDN